MNPWAEFAFSVSRIITSLHHGAVFDVEMTRATSDPSPVIVVQT